MANSLPSVTPFSVAFGAALARVMKVRGVRQVPTAQTIGRNQGYVSERLRGLRAVDTDVIAGVAMVAGVTPRTIVIEVLAEMKRADGSDVD